MAESDYLTMGPEDPDRVGGIGTVGRDNQAKRLLQLHEASHSPELTAIMSRPRDEERSETLVLSEVEELLTAQTGQRAFFRPDDGHVLVDASVRGTSERDRAISVVYELPSGRVAQGAIDGIAAGAGERFLRESEANAQRMIEARRYGGEAGRAMVRDELADERRDRQAPDERLEAANKALDDRDRENDELRKRIAALEAAAANTEDEPPAQSGDTPQSLPEPWSGYDADPAADRAQTVREGDLDREALERVRAYEQARTRPSKQVLDAVAERI